MAALLITYDLRSQGQNYEAVDAYLETKPLHWRFLESAWIVSTPERPDQVRDALMQLCDGNDRVFVVDISRDAAAWFGFSPNDEWLKNAIIKG